VAVISAAQLMVTLDATIVNIALPTAQASLGFTDTDRQWVLTAYTLALGGLLLLGGRLADLLGRKRAFLAGLAGFAASSALAGAAPTFGVLVADRALQGAFAALLTPTALSLLAVTFTDPKARSRAFGVYGAVASSGAAAGLLLGGVLTQYASWRWCMFLNVTVALVAGAAGRRVLPDLPAGPRERLDVAGAALVTAGLVSLTFGCSQAATAGWTSPRVALPTAAGALLLAAFLVWQRRAPRPLLPLTVLLHRDRAGTYLAVAAAVVGSFGLYVLLTYYLHVVRGYSPVRTGLAFLPMTLAVVVSATGLARRLPRVSARTLISPPACSPPPPAWPC
jgi:EmrB/QacA subfamily drug resistance transporter